MSFSSGRRGARLSSPALFIRLWIVAAAESLASRRPELNDMMSGSKGQENALMSFCNTVCRGIERAGRAIWWPGSLKSPFDPTSCHWT